MTPSALKTGSAIFEFTKCCKLVHVAHLTLKTGLSAVLGCTPCWKLEVRGKGSGEGGGEKDGVQGDKTLMPQGRRDEGKAMGRCGGRETVWRGWDG